MVSAMLRDTFAFALQFRYDRGGRRGIWRARGPARERTGGGPRSAPELAAILERESNVLLAEYDRAGRRDDLDRAITAQENALAALPAGAPNRPRLNGNLMSAFGASTFGRRTHVTCNARSKPGGGRRRREACRRRSGVR